MIPKIVDLMQVSTCFGKDVCRTPPCACAQSLIDAITAAERERCAKIAETFARANMNLNPNEDEATATSSVAQAIANQIRVNN